MFITEFNFRDKRLRGNQLNKGMKSLAISALGCVLDLPQTAQQSVALLLPACLFQRPMRLLRLCMENQGPKGVFEDRNTSHSPQLLPKSPVAFHLLINPSYRGESWLSLSARTPRFDPRSKVHSGFLVHCLIIPPRWLTGGCLFPWPPRGPQASAQEQMPGLSPRSETTVHRLALRSCLTPVA